MSMSCLQLVRPARRAARHLVRHARPAIPCLPSACSPHGGAQGVGSAEDIDKGMVLGTAHKMGPLHLADFIGALPAALPRAAGPLRAPAAQRLAP